MRNIRSVRWIISYPPMQYIEQITSHSFAIFLYSRIRLHGITQRSSHGGDKFVSVLLNHKTNQLLKGYLSELVTWDWLVHPYLGDIQICLHNQVCIGSICTRRIWIVKKILDLCKCGLRKPRAIITDFGWLRCSTSMCFELEWRWRMSQGSDDSLV